jgi:hypothetical protein
MLLAETEPLLALRYTQKAGETERESRLLMLRQRVNFGGWSLGPRDISRF